jgi:hypothetical protein
MRWDLSKGEFNHTGQTSSQIPSNVKQQVEPQSLRNQDRAHNVIRLHWKLTKHGRHCNIFVPGWQTTSVLTLRSPPHTMVKAPSMWPWVATPHKPSNTNSTQVFHWGCSLIFKRINQQNMALFCQSNTENPSKVGFKVWLHTTRI